jgi:diguanylate cyclase (GGDEF)-like protein
MDGSAGKEGKEGDHPPSQNCAPQVLELLDEIYALEQFRREQILLRKLGGYLRHALTETEACAAVERFGPRLWPGATGAVYLLHPDEEYLVRAASWGDGSLHESTLSLRDCWAMRRSELHWVRDADDELPCAHVERAELALPSVCVPLMSQGRMLGLLNLQRLAKTATSPDHGVPTDPAAALAKMAAEDLSFMLASLSLRESLREQSIRDSLTGLYNRRFAEEFLVREIARAGRRPHPLSLVVLDIDHFKQINDTFGHIAGDMVLRKIGLVLQAHVRTSDVACRMGGEEFSLVFAELPLPVAVQRAEDIREALRKVSLTYESRVLDPVTASFGVAAYPDHGRTAEALFRAADRALYEAKRAGRDRVITATVAP